MDGPIVYCLLCYFVSCVWHICKDGRVYDFCANVLYLGRLINMYFGYIYACFESIIVKTNKNKNNNKMFKH